MAKHLHTYDRCKCGMVQRRTARQKYIKLIRNKYWVVRNPVNNRYIGCFKDPKEAIKKRNEAERNFYENHSV